MFISNAEKAKVLTQALPYIQKYTGKTVVVKYGGSAMINEGLRDAVISDLVLLSLVGIHVVLVHGGGPDISEMVRRLGHEPQFINGLRYTDEETMNVVEMVLAGKANKDLVNRIQQIGGRAVGVCGIDGGLIRAVKYEDGKNDYGQVGEITAVDPSLLTDNLARGYIPVVSTVALGCDDNAIYNVNADTAAAKIAIALGAQNLILLTDTRGVMSDFHDEDTLIPEIHISDIPALIGDGTISGGMIPKVHCCETAVQGGISRTCIIDGRIMHSILIEMFSDEGVGTMFIE